METLINLYKNLSKTAKIVQECIAKYYCHEIRVGQFIDKIGWSIDNLNLVLIINWPRAPRAL
jgi:dissimilatory sulfite reductase (desulfoviridin) alpha/beta subunit